MKNSRFLLLAALVGLSVTSQRALAIFGGPGGLGPFYVNDENDHQCLKTPTNVKKGCKPCEQQAPGPRGMPVWSVSEPFLNVWVADEPAAYRTSLGEELSFRLTNKQRDVRSTAHKFVPLTIVGGWSHNWFSYAHFRDANSGGGAFSKFDCVVYSTDGGEYDFGDGGNGAGSADPGTGMQILPMDGVNTDIYFSTNTPSIYGKLGCRIVYPDGSQDLYGQIATDYANPNNGLYGEWVILPDWTNVFSAFDALLTERIDPYGNSIHFNYTNSAGGWVLQSITDYDGVSTTFNYTFSGTNAPVLNSVSMPFGRTVQLTYTTSGYLGSITDAQTNTSTFNYSGQSYNGVFFLGSMTTPYYGTTTFYYTNNDSPNLADGTEIGNAGGTNRINRSVMITRPDGTQEMYVYRFDSSEVGIPQTLSQAPTSPWGTLDNGQGTNYDVCFANSRNSYHWDAKAMYTITNSLQHTNVYQFTAAEYALATVKHWLVETNDPGFVNYYQFSGQYRLSPYISWIREPSPIGDTNYPGQVVWYDYPGKDVNNTWIQPGITPSGVLPGVVAKTLPNGQTWYSLTDWYFWGIPNDITSTYGDGSKTRTTTISSSVLLNGQETCSTNNGASAQTTVDWQVPMLLGVTGPDTTQLLTMGGTATYVTNSFTNSLNGVNYVFTRIFPVRPQLNVTDAANNTNTVFFNNRNQVTGINQANGLITTNVYYANWLAQTTNLDSSGKAISTNYFSFLNGLLSTRTDERGLATAYTWDKLQRLASVTFPPNTTSYISNQYAYLDLTWHQDRLGNVSSAAYDHLDELKSSTDNRGKTTLFTYCTCGDLQSVTDPLNGGTTNYMDFNGRITNVVYSCGAQRYLYRNLLGQVSNEVVSSGLSITNQYNNQGLLTLVTSSNGTLFQATYNLYDQPTNIVTAEGVMITSTFDGLGRLATRGYPNGGVEQWFYSTNGLATYYDRQGHATYFGYDLAGRRTSITNANGEVTSFGYDPAGDVIAFTNGLSNRTTWAYDAYGRVIAETNANGVLVLTNGYDFNGNLTARWTLGKGLVSFQYDPNGNRTNAAYPRMSMSYSYDALNRMQTVSDAMGSSTLTYTNFGAFSSALASEGGRWSNDTISYTYVNGVLQGLTVAQPTGNWAETFTTDGELRLSKLTTPDGAYTNAYYGAGKLIQSLKLPGGCYITNDFYSSGTLADTWLKNPSGSILNHHGYTYDLNFYRTNATRTDASHASYSYDSIGQLIASAAYDTAGTTTPRLNEAFGYGYDKADNLTYRTNGTLNEAFTLDALNQLSSFYRSSSMTVGGLLNLAPQANSLLINNVGAAVYNDLTFATTNAVPLLNGTNTFTAGLKNSAGQILSQSRSATLPRLLAFYYDPNGNLTNDGLRTFEYDDANRLTTITLSNAWRCEYTYDGLSRRRITKQYGWDGSSWGTPTNEIHYLCDRMLPVQERNASNQPTVTYTRGPDLRASIHGAGGIAGLLARTDTNGVAFYHTDGGGNVTALINSAGTREATYLYDPFGNVLGMSGSLAALNLYRFSSKEVDSISGDYYYGLRFYDPNFQRWLNRDPAGEAGGLNLYVCFGNSPPNLIDPNGLWCVKQFLSHFHNPFDSVFNLVYVDPAKIQAQFDLQASEDRLGYDPLQAIVDSMDKNPNLIPTAGDLAPIQAIASTLADATMAYLDVASLIATPMAAAETGIADDFAAAELVDSTAAGGSTIAQDASAIASSAADSGAFSAIGSTGKVGEQWLAQNLGGESQVFFNTSQGARYVDQFAGGIANESKVGYQSLTPSIQLQISKDAELLNAGRVQGVDWHFFQSPVTGLGGPSQPLFNALQQNGINVIIH